jgi:adenine-specific DNA-methyltransferase
MEVKIKENNETYFEIKDVLISPMDEHKNNEVFLSKKNNKKEINDFFNDFEIKDNLKIIDFSKHFVMKANNLKALNYLNDLKNGIKESIDIIYIDPPYYFNKVKSAKSFKYNSNFNLATWITFMENRLVIARDLLNDDGIIYISINNDGVFHLKLLCDQIFGIKNFITNIVWNKQNNQNDTIGFQENTENILVYKKKNEVILKEKIEKVIPIIEKDGFSYLKKGGILKGGEDGFLNNSPSLGYTIYYNEKTKEVIPFADYDKEKAKIYNDYNLIYEDYNEELIKKGFVPIRPPISKGRIKRWTWGIDKMKKDNSSLLFTKNKKTGLFTITNLKKVELNNISNDKKYKEIVYVAPKNIINLSSSSGTSRLNNLFNGKESFAYSKPVELINYLLSIVKTDKKDLKIMDFFAGSGTTGESVLQLNKLDGKNRIFYLIEQMDYAKSLTFERVKLAYKDIYNKEDDYIQYIS